MTTGKGHRDLSLLRAGGSTARVLNLSFIQERFGETPEHAEQPFFRNRRLNRAILVKHALRRDERDLFARPPVTATKIILPYSLTDMSLGGVSLFVGQTGFRGSLKDGVGGYDEGADLEADLEILDLLDALPSFDPFVLRERLRQAGFEPAACYFDLSAADLERMRDFVAREIGGLVRLAFGGAHGGRDLALRMAEKLMNDATAKALEPLRATLNLAGRDYAEGVFAWKAFLYYAWSETEFAPNHSTLQASIAKAHIAHASPKQYQDIQTLRTSVLAALDRVLARVQTEIAAYHDAFAALTRGEPAPFRSFLLSAPDLFIPMGEAIGMVKHVASFWAYRFKDGAAVIPYEDALPLFEDFDCALAALHYAAPPKAIARTA